MRLVELRKKASGVTTDALIYQPIQSTLIILGYGAIIINTFFFLFGIFNLVFKKQTIAHRLMLFFNLVMFPVQIFYFFF